MMKRLHPFKRYLPFLTVAAILLVGAFLRLYRISEYLTFLGDEGRDVLVVMHMITGHKFTLLGPTASVGGFFLGPIYYYFMLPFLWLWHLDPTGPAVMVALFGIATIALVYTFTSRAFSRGAGYVAAALYALSPVVIAYSRSSWNPNVVPFFALALIMFLRNVAVKNRARDYALAGLMLGIGIQLHYLFLFLYAVSAVFFGIMVMARRITVQVRNLAAGAAGLAVGMSMFLAFELRHGFANTRSIIRFLQAGQDTGFSAGLFFSNIADVTYRLFARLVAHLPDAGGLARLAGAQATVWQGAGMLLTVISLGILAARLYISIANRRLGKGLPTVRSEEGVHIVLLAVWLAVPVLLFGLYRRDIYDYYLGIMFPLPFILTGMTFHYISGFKRLAPLAIAGVITLLAVNWQGRPFLYPPNNQLAQMRRIATTVLAQTGGRPFNFALLTSGNSDHAYRYFFELAGNAPVTIENTAVDPGRKTVTGQLMVICEYPTCEPLGNSLWEIAGFGRAEIAGEWEVPFVKIYKLIHYKGN